LGDATRTTALTGAATTAAGPSRKRGPDERSGGESAAKRRRRSVPEARGGPASESSDDELDIAIPRALHPEPATERRFVGPAWWERRDAAGNRILSDEDMEQHLGPDFDPAHDDPLRRWKGDRTLLAAALGVRIEEIPAPPAPRDVVDVGAVDGDMLFLEKGALDHLRNGGSAGLLDNRLFTANQYEKKYGQRPFADEAVLFKRIDTGAYQLPPPDDRKAQGNPLADMKVLARRQAARDAGGGARGRARGAARSGAPREETGADDEFIWLRTDLDDFWIDHFRPANIWVKTSAEYRRFDDPRFNGIVGAKKAYAALGGPQMARIFVQLDKDTFVSHGHFVRMIQAESGITDPEQLKVLVCNRRVLLRTVDGKFFTPKTMEWKHPGDFKDLMTGANLSTNPADYSVNSPLEMPDILVTKDHNTLLSGAAMQEQVRASGKALAELVGGDDISFLNYDVQKRPTGNYGPNSHYRVLTGPQAEQLNSVPDPLDGVRVASPEAAQPAADLIGAETVPEPAARANRLDRSQAGNDQSSAPSPVSTGRQAERPNSVPDPVAELMDRMRVAWPEGPQHIADQLAFERRLEQAERMREQAGLANRVDHSRANSGVPETELEAQASEPSIVPETDFGTGPSIVPETEYGPEASEPSIVPESDSGSERSRSSVVAEAEVGAESSRSSNGLTSKSSSTRSLPDDPSELWAEPPAASPAPGSHDHSEAREDADHDGARGGLPSAVPHARAAWRQPGLGGGGDGANNSQDAVAESAASRIFIRIDKNTFVSFSRFSEMIKNEIGEIDPRELSEYLQFKIKTKAMLFVTDKGKYFQPETMMSLYRDQFSKLTSGANLSQIASDYIANSSKNVPEILVIKDQDTLVSGEAMQEQVRAKQKPLAELVLASKILFLNHNDNGNSTGNYETASPFRQLTPRQKHQLNTVPPPLARLGAASGSGQHRGETAHSAPHLNRAPSAPLTSDIRVATERPRASAGPAAEGGRLASVPDDQPEVPGAAAGLQPPSRPGGETINAERTTVWVNNLRNFEHPRDDRGRD
jgi:hypothetical protein